MVNYTLGLARIEVQKDGEWRTLTTMQRESTQHGSETDDHFRNRCEKMKSDWEQNYYRDQGPMPTLRIVG